MTTDQRRADAEKALARRQTVLANLRAILGRDAAPLLVGSGVAAAMLGVSAVTFWRMRKFHGARAPKQHRPMGTKGRPLYDPREIEEFKKLLAGEEAS